MTPDDETLARAWAAGDLDAGGALLKRHTGLLHRFFRNKVAMDEIRDLVQEVFEGCVKGISKYQGNASFTTYLLKVARNRLYDHYRRREVRVRGLDGFEAEQATVAELYPGLSTLFAAGEEQRLLIMGLRRLSVEEQVLLEYYYYEGLRAPELAALYADPEGTIRSRLRRARENLEVQIRRLKADPRVIESTVTDLAGWAAKVRAQMDGGS
ncbi:MAG: sigma-70 family RNA polymerase sigma factor [Nannocystis sp.]|nr:sigma-70 family RNA polymerase sigma factor [Nannocystis sp.]